jgi:uncharacterized repeat protein (TIGR03943 family)
VNRQAQGVVLLLVGGAILRASLTDLYLRYVKEGLRPFLIVAGLLLVAAAVATLWYELRSQRSAAEDEQEDEHGHAHHEPRVAWLLVLPVLALLLVAPPALGSYAANRTGTALQQPSDYPALPAGDPVQLSVLDYATRAVYDDGRSLGNRRVRLSGFVLVGHDGAPYLTRMVLSCCAADAQPVKIGMTGQVPSGLQADTWLEVTGKYTAQQLKDDVNEGVIPFIEVSTAKRIPAPHNQYET